MLSGLGILQVKKLQLKYPLLTSPTNEGIKDLTEACISIILD